MRHSPGLCQCFDLGIFIQLETCDPFSRFVFRGKRHHLCREQWRRFHYRMCKLDLSTPATLTIHTYFIQSIDQQAGDMSFVATNDLESCIGSCANTTGCVDVSLRGPACYLKSSLSAALSDSGIMGAKLVSISCSASNSTIFTILTGTLFDIEWGVDHVGRDMISIAASSFPAYIQACGTIPGCVCS